ncbi:MAG: FAD-dependent oxidoreductase [Bacteriovoracaceae bacterium]
MNTNLNKPPSPEESYDAIIVGAGIVGIQILNELSGHGLKTLLIDQDDFCSQTSAASSKMLHGGIRYLENYDFSLVREAQKEKKRVSQLAPHVTYEETFHLPVYEESLRPAWQINIGTKLYNFFSNSLKGKTQWLNKNETLKKFPHLDPNGLKGCALYEDVIMDDRKLAIDLLLTTLKRKEANAINHLSLEKVSEEGDIYRIQLKDQITKKELNTKAKAVIYACGPFTDKAIKKTFTSHDDWKWFPVVLASKGSHIWIANNNRILSPIVMTPNDGRVIFIIPRENNRVLIGTTEVSEIENFDSPSPSGKEIDYIIDNFNEYFPNMKITTADIIGQFSGIRPLIQEGHGHRGKTARHHKIYRPAKNVFTIAGGKWTTFCVMGRDIAKEVLTNFKISYNPHHSQFDIVPLSGFYAQNIQELSKAYKENSNDAERKLDKMLKQVLSNEFVRTQDDLERRIGLKDSLFKFDKELEELILTKVSTLSAIHKLN